MSVWRWILILCILVLVAGSGALAVTLTRLHSGQSANAPLLLSSKPPAPSCASAPPADPRERLNYEPMITTNPIDANTDHSSLIAVWTTRDLVQVQAEGHTAIATSHDGGQSWTSPHALLPSCGFLGSTFTSTDDPWVSVGPDGTAYLTVLGEGNNRSYLLVAASRDGGRTWKHQQAIDLPSGANIPDKPSVTADPLTPGAAYVTWDRLDPYGEGLVQAPVWLATTRDGGSSWKKRKVLPASKVFGAYATQLVVDPHTDALYLTFVDFRNRTENGKLVSSQNVGFVRSANHGETWSAPTDVGTVVPDTSDQSIFTHWVGHFRVGFFPAMALDVLSHRLYVVWWVPTAKTGLIRLSSSADGGSHWSKPIDVNEPSDGPAFTPTVAVSSQGIVGVTYFSHVASVKGQQYPTKYWFRSSSDGTHFTKPISVAGPFDHAGALKRQDGYFLGDYMGLTTSGERFHPIFIAATNRRDKGDVFTTSVSP